MAVRKDYVAPTELENLMILISTNMQRLTALGIFVRVFCVVRGGNEPRNTPTTQTRRFKQQAREEAGQAAI